MRTPKKSAQKNHFFFNFVQLLASFVRLIHVKRLKKPDFHHKQ